MDIQTKFFSESCLRKTICVLIGLIVIVLGWGCPALQAQILQGRCSYYAQGFQGKPMACGGRFDTAAYTAAHIFLPCGTIVKVKNLANGKWILLRIADRGPFSKTLVLDVSRTAARHLDMFKSGMIRAQIEVIALPENGKNPDFEPAMGQD